MDKEAEDTRLLINVLVEKKYITEKQAKRMIKSHRYVLEKREERRERILKNWKLASIIISITSIVISAIAIGIALWILR